MPSMPFRRPSRGAVFRFLTIASLVLVVLVVVLSVWVYFEAVRTFEVRRVSLPTRVFADMTPLRVGAPIGGEELRARLARLGYRKDDALTRPGTWHEGEGGVQIHLRPFDHPSGEWPAQVVTVRASSSAIEEVTVTGGEGSAEPALEPELLTSIMGDQLENRSPVPFDAVPQHLKDAVVVAEDARFYQHPGVDPLGILRALVRNIRAGGAAEGGSTLTQQLVKNYYLTNERTLRRKVVEAFMAIVLEAKYSKDEILEAYLNDIYLGRNRSISILGVGQASRFYFGKPVTEISIGESALLASMIPSPNNYSPFTDADRARGRRDTVLRQMQRAGKITEAEMNAALEESLPEEPTRERAGLGSIPYYVDRVIQEIRRDYGIDEVEGRGLQIYTAIDLEWQAAAASQLQEGLRRLERSSAKLRRKDEPLQGAVMAVDVATGEIRALVGGRNYEESQFNRITSAHRQVGSLFKPFVLLAAFEPSLSRQNITPATLVNDARFVLERRYAKDWSPRNYEGHYYGIVTVRQALEKSMNSASVRLGLSAGVESVIRTAAALGVETEMEAHPSLILGAVDATPVEMAEAYTTMARMGSRMPLRTIRWVATEGGEALSEESIQPVQVFPARDVFLGVHVMEGVMSRGTGAGARALGFRKTAAGKTGTTNDKRDAWFIGFTPHTLALTWVGFDDNTPVGVSGSDGAIPIWARTMREITAAEESSEFPVPGGIVFAQTDLATGGLATDLCPRGQVIEEAFKVGTEPRAPCPVHRPPPEPILDPYGMPLGPDGLPLPYDPSQPYDPGYPPLDPGTTTQPAPQPLPPTATAERPAPVLGGGNFPTRDAPTTTEIEQKPPVRLPAPLPKPKPEPPPETKEPPPTSTAPTSTAPTSTASTSTDPPMSS